MDSTMALSGQVIWAAIIGFLIGVLSIWLFERTGKGSGKRLQKSYDELKKSHSDYQQQVNEHFVKTADAVDKLSKSYQEVFTHLSTGAEKLMDEKALKLEREKRQGKTVTLAYLTNAKDTQATKAVDKNRAMPEARAFPEDEKTASSVGDNYAQKHNDSAKNPPQKDNTDKKASDVAAQKSPTLKAEEKMGHHGNSDKAKSAEDSTDAIKRHLHDTPPSKKAP